MTRRIPKKQPVVLTKAEVGKIFDELGGLKRPACYRAALALMWRGGLRVSEVVNLTPPNLKLDDGFLIAREGKGAKDRTVPIHPAAEAALRSWLEKRPERAKYLLTNRHGKRLSVRYLEQLVKKLAIRAGVPDAEKVHPHTFRHSFATEAVKHMPLHAVQEILGHESLASTGIYLHIRPEHLKEYVRGWDKDETAF